MGNAFENRMAMLENLCMINSPERQKLISDLPEIANAVKLMDSIVSGTYDGEKHDPVTTGTEIDLSKILSKPPRGENFAKFCTAIGPKLMPTSRNSDGFVQYVESNWMDRLNRHNPFFAFQDFEDIGLGSHAQYYRMPRQIGITTYLIMLALYLEQTSCVTSIIYLVNSANNKKHIEERINRYRDEICQVDVSSQLKIKSMTIERFDQWYRGRPPRDYHLIMDNCIEYGYNMDQGVQKECSDESRGWNYFEQMKFQFAKQGATCLAIDTVM